MISRRNQHDAIAFFLFMGLHELRFILILFSFLIYVLPENLVYAKMRENARKAIGPRAERRTPHHLMNWARIVSHIFSLCFFYISCELFKGMNKNKNQKRKINRCENYSKTQNQNRLTTKAFFNNNNEKKTATNGRKT